MGYSITITYTGVSTDNLVNAGMPICGTYVPTNSYVDSEAYKDTVYNTNVPGFGYVTSLADYVAANTMHPGVLAQFKAAAESTEKTITFTVDDPYMATYYSELNGKIAGYTVEVKNNTLSNLS